jgi:nitrate reductase gamma subunit
MHSLYNFVAGPLAWAAFILFFGGLLFQLIRLLLQVRSREPFISSYMSWHYSLRSILHWIIPFGTVRWRTRPVLTVVTFVFHLSLFLTPIFLLSHIVLWDETWGLTWWALPDALADIMCAVVIACCVFFGVRRWKQPEVRFVTDSSDYFILVLTVAPFVTGFLAYHQWTEGAWMTILHIFSGELLLAVIPFTRLSHMLLAWLTRSYMGSEFGGVRHARDW